MKVKILKTTMADMKLVKAGDVVEISLSAARKLIQLGKAEEIKDGGPAKAEPKTAAGEGERDGPKKSAAKK
ncbi:MAG: hypothetical protein P1S46_06150 [bacterium]|nr:hypothetical protein [bacterium]